MQRKLLLALFCAIFAHLIQVNYGAPAGPKTVPAREDPTPSRTVPLPGPHGSRTVLLPGPDDSRTIPFPGPGGSRIVPGAGDASKRPMPGARMAWSANLDKTSKKLFKHYKSVITKKLRMVHKLPALYTPKPSKYATQLVAGTLYHYLVKIPGNKYAHVTIAHQPWLKNKLGSEENVNVRPQLYGLNEVL